MFRYEARAFTQTANALQNACSELDRYEEEIRRISREWSRNPALPAPRERLRRGLERLEEKETSLNMLKRKLESAARLYEAAENRVLDLAEEMGSGTGFRDPDSSPMKDFELRYGEDDTQREGHDALTTGEIPSGLAEFLIDRMIRLKFMPMPNLYLVLPRKKLLRFKPHYPWRYRPYPAPFRPPFTPDAPMFPPRRPYPFRRPGSAWTIWNRRGPVKKPQHLPPVPVLREVVTLWRDGGNPALLQPLGIESAERQARRNRMDRLFRTSRPR